MWRLNVLVDDWIRASIPLSLDDRLMEYVDDCLMAFPEVHVECADTKLTGCGK